MEITGRLTADATVTTVKNSDKQVVNFDVAVNDSYKTKVTDEVKKIVTFFRCSYWLSTAIAKHLTKGSLVELSGRISVNAYINQQGEAKATLNFHVNNIKLHGSPKHEAATETVPAPVPAGELTEPLDDLPF